MSFKWMLTKSDKDRLSIWLDTKSTAFTINLTSMLLSSPTIISELSNYDNVCCWELQFQLEPKVDHLPTHSHFYINLEKTNLLGPFCIDYEISLFAGSNESLNEYVYYKSKSLFDMNNNKQHKINKFTSASLIRNIVKLEKIEISFKVNMKILETIFNDCFIIKEIPDFEKILNDKKSSDFIIACSEKEFYVHKIILAARSEVFSAMFDLDMKEKQEGKTKIEDCTPEVVQELLRFIYCGKVENLENIHTDLLKAANKYLIRELSTVCLRSLCKTIDTRNAVELLLTAIDYQADDAFKSKIINFIALNFKEVRKHSDFKILTDPSVLQEILNKSADLWL